MTIWNTDIFFNYAIEIKYNTPQAVESFIIRYLNKI